MGSKLLRRMTAALLVGAAMIAGPALAADDTLEDALSAAYTTNPDLLAERARLRATDETVAQAISGWRPTVTVQGTYGSTRSESTFPPFATDTETNEPWSGSVTASQPVFQGGRVYAQVRQSKALVRAGRAQLTAFEQQILLAAVTSYMDVVRDEAVVELNRNQVEVLKRQLQAANDRFEVGEITRTDVAQAEARVALAQSNLTAAEAALTNSRSAYERLIGRPPGALEKTPPQPALPDSEAAALDLARQVNPALIAARESERASEFSIDLAIGGLLPTLSVEARYTRTEGSSGPDSESETSTVQGVLTVPIYQGGGEYSRIRQARAENSQQKLLVAQTTREVEEDVKNAWDALRSARSAIKSDQEQVRANEIALDGVQQEAQVGARTTLDVLDAEQELLNSRVALVRSQRNEIVAAYALLAAIGGMTAENLKLPVEIYDPLTNYDDVSGAWIGFGSSE